MKKNFYKVMEEYYQMDSPKKPGAKDGQIGLSITRVSQSHTKSIK